MSKVIESDRTIRRLWAHVIGFTILIDVLAFLFHPLGILGTKFFGITPTMYSAPMFLFGIILEVSLALVVWLVIRIEKPRDWKAFLRVGPPDLYGMFLYWAFSTIFVGVSALFLQNWLWTPIQDFLQSLGLPGEPQGASLPVPSIQLSPTRAVVGFVLLLLVIWAEVPEEFFFRGYVQNQLQGRYGRVAAVFLGALLWTSMHVGFAPANFVETICWGMFTMGPVFALRQNVTPNAIMHPLDNRAGLMAIVFLQIFGVSISGAWTYWLVENAFLWILALSVVGAWSYHNRKEVKAKLNTSASNQN
jgi:membrane protease YdiL (CAAX protease family)